MNLNTSLIPKNIDIKSIETNISAAGTTVLVSNVKNIISVMFEDHNHNWAYLLDNNKCSVYVTTDNKLCVYQSSATSFNIRVFYIVL